MRRVLLSWMLLWLVGFRCLGADAPAPREALRPRHITPEAQLAVQRGLEYLAKTQSQNGSFDSAQDGAAYPLSMTAMAGMAFLANGNTTSRGPYASNVRKAASFIMKQITPSGLLVGPGGENGRPMYGHGFSLLFLSVAYGMETDAAVRERMAEVIKKAIELTTKGQSALGGWTYTPGAGDEGSVTVTQMQGLRAAHNAGFTVPKSVIAKAIRYLEMCRTPEGGIRYSYASGNSTRLPISAAAITCLYSAGEYESDLADSCLSYCYNQFQAGRGGTGHDSYLHLYASQAFYQAGDKYWDAYFPKVRDDLIKRQDKKSGAWATGGGWSAIGPIFNTSVGLIVLQLPYKFLPIYQR